MKIPTRSARMAVAGGGLALLLTVSACGSSGDTTAAAPPSSAAAAASSMGMSSMTMSGDAAAASGTVEAADQDSDGKTIVVASVDLEGIAGGWIAIHQDLDGKPGPIVGVAAVPEGMTKDLTVTLDAAATTGAFWPMLHVDDGVIGTYEFPKVKGADLPVKTGSDIVMKKIAVTVK